MKKNIVKKTIAISLLMASTSITSILAIENSNKFSYKNFLIENKNITSENDKNLKEATLKKDAFKFTEFSGYTYNSYFNQNQNTNQNKVATLIANHWNEIFNEERESNSDINVTNIRPYEKDNEPGFIANVVVVISGDSRYQFRGDINFYGFDRTRPTTQIKNEITYSENNKFPDEWYKSWTDHTKIQDLIFEKKDEIFSDLPQTLTKDNIVLK